MGGGPLSRNNKDRRPVGKSGPAPPLLAMLFADNLKLASTVPLDPTLDPRVLGVQLIEITARSQRRYEEEQIVVGTNAAQGHIHIIVQGYIHVIMRRGSSSRVSNRFEIFSFITYIRPVIS